MFNENSTWNLQLNISPSNKLIVLITHNKTMFNANDDKR